MQISDELIREFLEEFPDLPDPEHYPKAVNYFIKIFLYRRGLL